MRAVSGKCSLRHSLLEALRVAKAIQSKDPSTQIHYKSLYREMAARPQLLLELIVQICRALALLSECEVVHSDLKT